MAWVRDALESLGVRPSKQRGQNFLSSIQDARNLVRASEVESGRKVIEVGPGLGAMTQGLLESGVCVHAVEIEEKFANYLKDKFASYDSSFQVHLSDFRKFDPSTITSEPIALVSNVPYVFSTDMLLWMIKHRELITKGSLLLQKEFAERVAADEGSKTYGSLSVLAQLFFKVRLGMEVHGNAFYPKAEVASRQLHLEVSDRYSKEIDDPEAFQLMVRAAFSMRRKMLMNCLMGKGLVADRTEGEKIFDEAGVSLKARAEDLSIQNFITLYKVLCKRSGVLPNQV